MSDIINRLNSLGEHKERVKHKRGMHNQFDHTRRDYLAAGLIGDDGGGNDNVRRDAFQKTRMGGGMPALSSVISNASETTFANRRRSSESGTATTAPRSYVGARPNRQAAYGLQSGRAMRSGALRGQAVKMGQEYRRRHRMQKATAPAQGVVSPNAMKAKPMGAFFEPENPEASLFENPSRILGNDPLNPGRQTNMDEYVMGGLDQEVDQMQQVLEDAGMPSDKATEYMDRLAAIYGTQYESHMRKAAATFAMDIQGFVGGEVYSNDDLEFTAARAMSVAANSQMQTNQLLAQALWDEIRDEYPDAHGAAFWAIAGKTPKGSDAPRPTNSSLGKDSLGLANTVIAGWASANPAPSEMAVVNREGNLETASMPVNTRQLARINPALATDVASRMSTEGTGTQSRRPDARQSLTMSLDSLWGTLHPQIRSQLSRLLKADVKQPQTDDASLAFEDRQTASLGAENQRATTAFKSVLQSLHTDGGIADVRVAEANLPPGATGMFSASPESLARYGVRDPNVPHIVLSPESMRVPEGEDPFAHKMSVMAHEFGHLIDSTAMTYGEADKSDGICLSDLIGQHGGLPDSTWQTKGAMVAPMLRILNRWMDGPRKRTLDALEDPSLDPRTRGESRQALIYLSQPREVFARLYQQWVNNETIKRIDAGETVQGVDDPKATRDTLEKMNSRLASSGLAQRFFEPADYDEAVKDLFEIFTAMGWKLK